MMYINLYKDMNYNSEERNKAFVWGYTFFYMFFGVSKFVDTGVSYV